MGSHHGDDIKAIRSVNQTQHAPVRASSSRNLPSFAEVDIHLWRCELARRACLYFDKAKHRPVITDHINFGVDDHASPVAAHGQGNVGRHHLVTRRFQMLESQRLALPTEFKMRRRGYRRCGPAILSLPNRESHDEEVFRSNYSLACFLTTFASFNRSLLVAVSAGASGAVAALCSFGFGRLLPKVPRWIFPRRER